METVITELGFAEADAQLEQMILRAISLEATAFPVIAEDFRRMQAKRFDNNGPGWAPLAASTIARKSRKGYPTNKILHATGVLRDSLTKSGAPGSVVRVTPDELFMGTHVPYAQYHQQGTKRMPKRVIVDIGEEDAARWGRILQGALGDTSVVSAALDSAIVG